MYFRNLRFAKYVVREVPKKSRLRTPFEKLHGKRSRTLMKSEGTHLYQIY